MIRVRPGRAVRLMTVAGLAAVAFLARLVPVLNGGGLYGYGTYDDAVYFAAGAGLAEGRVPYRDFLLLHPPGIVVALAPFAALTHLFSDAQAFAAARIAWMLMGALSTVLVLLVLAPLGRFGATFGALAYALFYPAVYSEHTTLLEAPASCALLAALLIIGRRPLVGDRPDALSGWRSQLPWVVAGVCLGASPTFKIWGVVPVLVVAVWVGLTRGWIPLSRLLAGIVLVVGAVLGPFFLAAPSTMWRLVVLDQLGRGDSSASVATRGWAIAGLGLYHASARWTIIVAGLVWLGAILLALRLAFTRFFAVLHLALAGLLLITPSWFTHYAALTAPTAALVLGAAASMISRRLRAGWARRLGRAALLLALIAFAAVPLGTASFGQPFARNALAPAARFDGCVTTDDPTNLIELDLLDRNLDRECRLVVDLGGYSYDEPVAGPQVPRWLNPVWQQTLMTYLRSGSVSILSRFNPQATFSAKTARVIHGWRLVARSGHVVARIPDSSRGPR